MSATTFFDIQPSSAKKAGKKAVEPTVTSEEGKIKADFRYKKGGTVKKDKFVPFGKEKKFAKGGGIESRGKTKGKSFGDGPVTGPIPVRGFARGGGIESRGKTRGKMC